MKKILLFLIFLSIYSCVPPESEKLGAPNIDWGNAELQAIVDLRDKRRADLLATYLKDSNYEKRFLAVESFGSIKDTSVLEDLSGLLVSDPSNYIRENAAYALGQSGSPMAESLLIDAFAKQDTADANSAIRMAILEAVGKVGTEKTLDLLASVSSYTHQDDKLLLGLSRGLYQFGLRGITTSSGTQKIVDLLKDEKNPVEARVMAANYLYRMKGIDLTDHINSINTVLSDAQDPRIRMSLIVPLARSKDVTQLPTILEKIKQDEDYRVKINGIRALANYPYQLYRDSIINYLSDDNRSVAITTSEIIKSQCDAQDARNLIQVAVSQNDPIIRANLLSGAGRSMPYYYYNTRKSLTSQIVDDLGKSLTIYEKTAFIDALSQDPLNYKLIYEQALESGDQVVATNGVLAFRNILTSNKFDRTYPTRLGQKQVRGDITKYLMNVFNSNNIGAMATAANLLRDANLQLKEEVIEKEPLRAAIRKMKVPQEVETKIELQRTLAYLEDREFVQEALDYNHPIDWNMLNTLSDSTRIYVVTSQGQLEIEVYPKSAPGSVANFIKLIESDFYDGNTFHRVVPNFVVQAGCTRGDGYGSLDYSIRSEFNMEHYDNEGYIGMASAGPDTESAQWFITHSPTPHLDGRYTIFGKVIKGMEVVHRIQQGDVIQDIRVFKG